MTRCQLWKWYCCSVCYDNDLHDSNAVTDIDEKDMNQMAPENEVRKIHHKRCYAELILRCQEAKTSLNTIKGYTMSKYIDLYESKHNEINETDKSVVKTLTRDTLFCPKCHRHLDKSDIEKHLVTPWPALLDYSSVMIFLFIPIAYIPLLIIFCLLAFKDWIFKSTQGVQESQQDYTNQHFDSEYFTEIANNVNY
eukprot:382873_1